jgi:hypothetical protein
MASADSQQKPTGAFSDAANRIRDSAKWLLGAFAAVGAVLAAGLQLADLGRLAADRSDHRLQWAVVGVGAAVLGIGIAIGAATSVITRSFVTLQWLAAKDRRHRRIDKDKVLLANHDSVPALYRNSSNALKAQLQAVQDWESDPKPEKEEKLREKADVVHYYDLITRKVIEQASYRRLSRAYSRARAFMLLGAAVAAGGITLFAWAAHPPAIQNVPVVIRTPTDVMVTFTPRGVGLFSSVLGRSCDLETPISAVAVRDIGAGYEVAIVPTRNCHAAMIMVTAQDAVVVPSSGS